MGCCGCGKKNIEEKKPKAPETEPTAEQAKKPAEADDKKAKPKK